MIRHARSRLPAPILPLPVAMVEAPFQTLLVAAVGAAPLLASGLGAAGGAAITLSAVTVPTDPEHGVASAAAANALTEDRYAMNHHPARRRAWTKQPNYGRLEPASMRGDPLKVAKPEPRRCKRRGSTLAYRLTRRRYTLGKPRRGSEENLNWRKNSASPAAFSPIGRLTAPQAAEPLLPPIRLSTHRAISASTLGSGLVN